MKYRTAFTRFTKAVFCGVLLLVGGLTVGYFTPRRWNTSQANCQNKPYRIYVAGDATHVNLIVPVQNSAYDWRSFLNPQQIGRDLQDDYRYLQMGWGDRKWYIGTPSWDQMNYSDIVRVLFSPGNRSVMHLQGFLTLPSDPNVTLRCVGVDRSEYFNFVKFVKASFQHDANGKPIHLKFGTADNSGFYEATGYYSVLKTCNTWSAEALDSVHVPTPLWSAIAPAVMHHIRGACPCN
jgi:uncharacterized protein (TIGR02117 family)